MNESQRRAYAALGIGPAWRPRRAAARAVGATAAGSLAESIAAEHAAVGPPDPAWKAAPTADASDVARMEWPQLREAVSQCRACGLCETRTRTVFGTGDERAGWMVVGEAPGAEEDRLGEPFVGNAGRLLDQMLAALGLARGHDVFIANVLKCRPPQNRDPSPDEMHRCEPYLRRQIELLVPRVIVVVGRIAAQSLLRTEASVASLRGRVHAYRVGERAVPVVVTYHPAYLLRSPPDKARAWADLCLARRAHDAATAP
ncbi:MAG: uracil-DNA glycosylase [Burkholderiaceae bacterium]